MNSEKKKAKNAEYRSKKREELNRKQRDYVARNKKAVKDRAALHYRKNRDAIISAVSAYQKKNRPKCNEHCAKYREKNRWKIGQLATERRARKSSTPLIDLRAISKWQKKVRNKSVVRCYWCEMPTPGDSSHFDHIVPLKLGGSHEIGNLCVSCPSCNYKKNAKDLNRWNEIIDRPVLF